MRKIKRRSYRHNNDDKGFSDACLQSKVTYNANKPTIFGLAMIERADINSVLMQMRAMKADAQQGVIGVNKLTSNMAPQPVEKTEGFGTLLKTAVDKVHETQQTASRMATAYEQGDPSVELTQVMVQLQKASVSFEAMTQVRNRLVTAYEDIMKMPV